jgi:predicted GIY-YIG superfamily endonuclease
MGKDNLGLRTLGVYRIPCECGKVYIGQTGHYVDTRLKGHQRHIRLEHPEHTVDLGHRIQFHKTSILTTKTRYTDCIVREATGIELHPNNMNWEATFCLSKSWKSLICSLKKPPEHDARSTRLQGYEGPRTLTISSSEGTGSMLSQ